MRVCVLRAVILTPHSRRVIDQPHDQPPIPLIPGMRPSTAQRLGSSLNRAGHASPRTDRLALSVIAPFLDHLSFSGARLLHAFSSFSSVCTVDGGVFSNGYFFFEYAVALQPCAPAVLIFTAKSRSNVSTIKRSEHIFYRHFLKKLQ